MSGSERIRLFAGVALPEAHLATIDAAVTELKRALTQARWAPVEKQHVTLKFLGRVSLELLPAVEEACARAAGSHQKGEARVTQLGAFPSVRRARVLWAGLEDSTGTLSQLAGGLNEALAPLGFEAEKRAYTPHLTLARFKVPARLEGPLPELPENRLPPFPIQETVLWRSHLSPKGASYEQISRYPLR